MAIDFDLPTLSTTYATFLDYIRDNIIACASMDFTAASNIPDGAIRWDSANYRFQSYDSSGWTDLALHAPSGTILLFGNSTAPTGWTRKTDWTDGSMLCFSATGSPSSGGTVNPQVAHTHAQTTHTHGAGSLRFETFHVQSPGALHGYDSSETGSAVLSTRSNVAVDGASDAAYFYNTSTTTYFTRYGTGSSATGGGGATGGNSIPYYREIIAATKD